MNRLLKAAAALLCVCGIGFATVARAQTTTVTASHLKMAGSDITAGTVVFVAVDANETPISFAQGSAGGLNGGLPSPLGISCAITTGALSGCVVPDAALTTPANICYNITVSDTSTGHASSGKNFILHKVCAVTGSTWALDLYAPPATAGVPPLISQYIGASPPPSTCNNGTIFITSSFGGAQYVCINNKPVLVYGTRPTISYPSYVAWGDSTTAPGFGCSTPAKCLVSLVANAVGTGSTNLGQSGAQACDIGSNIFSNTSITADYSNPLQTIIIGINDANNKGAGSYESVYKLCHKAAIAWRATAPSNRYIGSSFGSLPTNWSNDTTYGTTGIKTTTNGACSAWPIVTAGGPIVIWYRAIDSNGGVFTYSVDSAPTVTLQNTTSPAIATSLGATSAIIPEFITGIAAGSHSVNICATSATGAGNIVSILGVGTTPLVPYYLPPAVFVGGVAYQLNDTKSADTSAYNADAKSDVQALQALGFNVTFYDLRAYLSGAPADMTDTLHPDDAGYAKEVAGMVQTIKPVQDRGAIGLMALTKANGAYTVQGSDGVIFGYGGSTFTLPAGLPLGKTVEILNWDPTSTGTPISIVAGGGSPVNGASIPVWQSAIFVTDGSAWFNILPPSGSVVPSPIQTIASATTLATAPTSKVVITSGTTSIATIPLPPGLSGTVGGCFDLIPSGTQATTTAGNIQAIYTLTSGTLYRVCYNGSKWFVK